MRRTCRRWSLGVFVLVAFAAAGGFGETENAGAQLESHVYLPIAAPHVDLSKNPAPSRATATPTPTETVSVPPSQTPLPTETPKPTGGGKISGRMLLLGEPLAEHTGAEYPGPGIFLRVCRGSETDCSIVDRVGVDADGRYELTYPTALEGGEFVQVIWWNEFGLYGDHEVSGDSTYLGAWYGPRITRLDTDLGTTMPDFELGNIELRMPSKGGGFRGFPIPFEWDRWYEEPKAYRWSICHCCQNLLQRPGAYQKSVGKSTDYLLDSQPPGTRVDPDERYCWFIQVDAAQGQGYGHSFEARMMWFYFDVLSLFGLVRTADWTSR